MTEEPRSLLPDFICDQRIKEIKQDIQRDEQDFKYTKKTRIIKWAELLENKAINGSFDKPISFIAAHICNELREMGCLAGMQYIYRILDRRFKTNTGRPPNLDEDYDSEFPQGKALSFPVIERPETASQKEVIDAILQYQSAEDEYSKRLSIAKAERNKLIEIAEEKGWPIPGLDTNKKQTPSPYESFQGEFWGATNRLYLAVKRWAHGLEQTLENVEHYPETDLEWDSKAAESVNALAETIETLADIQTPYADKKWAQDYPGWWRTQARREDHGKHSAAVWGPIAPVDPITGEIDKTQKPRPLTREQVGDRSAQLLETQLKFSKALEGLQYWIRFSEWYRRGKLINCISTRRIDVSPILSESSFGSDKDKNK